MLCISQPFYLFSLQPGSRWWHTINPYAKCPLYAVWLACLVAFLLALPYLGNSTAYSAITSLSTICLYISYILPIICKLIYSKRFVRGPFHLGPLSVPINILAVIWVSFIVVLFVLPPIHPVTASTMNYASVGVGAVIIFAGLGYALSARHWFRGPVTNLDSNEINPDYLVTVF